MAHSSPRGHTLLLCFCSVLIFREQLFQRINTLPCRRNSRKHPASDSSSRCPSSRTFLCQKRRGFVSCPAKGWELQTLYSRARPKEITFQSAELKLWSCWLKMQNLCLSWPPQPRDFWHPLSAGVSCPLIPTHSSGCLAVGLVGHQAGR